MREDRPSSTAALIAAATVFLARDPRVADLVPAGAAPLCERCLESISLRGTVQRLSSPALRWAGWLAERATIPGLLLHFMLRKRWIEEAVRVALAEGCAQVVVIGAGFDTLALRLSPEFPRASFLEIDHPATQARKRAAAADAPANLHFVAADLARTRLRDALGADGAFRPEARSVFVVEGLLMYLAEDEVAAVFAALHEVSRAGARVVFTVMEPAPDGRSAFHNATPFVRWLLYRWSEPFKSALPRDEAAKFLARFGYRLLALADRDTLRGRYLAPARAHLALARGELIVVAQS